MFCKECGYELKNREAHCPICGTPIDWSEADMEEKKRREQQQKEDELRWEKAKEEERLRREKAKEEEKLRREKAKEEERLRWEKIKEDERFRHEKELQEKKAREIYDEEYRTELKKRAADASDSSEDDQPDDVPPTDDWRATRTDRPGGKKPGGKKTGAVAAAIAFIGVTCGTFWWLGNTAASDKDSSYQAAKAYSEASEAETAEAEPEAAAEDTGASGSAKAKKDAGESAEAADESSKDSKAEETKKKKKKKEDSSPAKVLTSAPDVSGYSSIKVTSASATSTISQTNTDNRPILLFDNREDTNWQEGLPGYGAGEGISCVFDRNHTVRYLSFKLGIWRNDNYFRENDTPKTLTIQLGSTEFTVSFPYEKKEQWVELKEPVSADSMSLTIDEIYVGTEDWMDTGITDICIYGN